MADCSEKMVANGAELKQKFRRGCANTPSAKSAATHSGRSILGFKVLPHFSPQMPSEFKVFYPDLPAHRNMGRVFCFQRRQPGDLTVEFVPIGGIPLNEKCNISGYKLWGICLTRTLTI